MEERERKGKHGSRGTGEDTLARVRTEMVMAWTRMLAEQQLSCWNAEERCGGQGSLLGHNQRGLMLAKDLGEKFLPEYMAGLALPWPGLCPRLRRQWVGLGQGEGPALFRATAGQARAPLRAVGQGREECGHGGPQAHPGCGSWHSHRHTGVPKPETSTYTDPAWGALFPQPKKLNIVNACTDLWPPAGLS